MAIREIEFRGKRVDNGEWVEGCYAEFVHGFDGYTKPGIQVTRCVPSVANRLTPTYETELVEVFPETIGQYTGIKDENGKGIYEGDIIRFIKENCLVIFVENDCAFRIEVDGRISTALRKAHSKDYEVIGNIHDEED